MKRTRAKHLWGCLGDHEGNGQHTRLEVTIHVLRRAECMMCSIFGSFYCMKVVNPPVDPFVDGVHTKKLNMEVSGTFPREQPSPISNASSAPSCCLFQQPIMSDPPHEMTATCYGFQIWWSQYILLNPWTIIWSDHNSCSRQMLRIWLCRWDLAYLIWLNGFSRAPRLYISRSCIISWWITGISNYYSH